MSGLFFFNQREDTLDKNYILYEFVLQANTANRNLFREKHFNSIFE